ncbi:protein kinase, partial [Desulfobacterales bacterium HSG16]|nr:protein kinase [Desulfobacterales bacterium HSG16]
MIATCDNCKTAFNVNDSLIKKEGIKVRCANCKHVFKIMPPKPEPLLQDSGQQQPLQASPPPPVPTKKPPVVAARKNLPEIKKPEFNPDQGFSGESTITIVDFSKDVFSPTEEVKERYVDLGSIGKGGMGEVLLAKDTQLLRKVAIKVLREDCATPATLMYFLREAQITAQLDHPNIVPLYTVKQPDEDEKNVSFVMKLIKGKDLHEITSAARSMYLENPKAKVPAEISMRSRLEHFIKACDGITYAHRKQVVHRDLKPANIMVGDYGE